MNTVKKEKTKYLSDGTETWTDLETASIQDPELAERLRKISRNYREPPKGDKQLGMFTPTISDVSAKDDISLMDLAVFTLGKKPRFEPIVHEKKDATITVSGSSAYGLATIFDYDIFLFIVSYLTNEMEKVRRTVKEGQDAYLPPRKIKPAVADLLKFCRRDDGGENYKQLEKAIERLKGTVISIKKKDGSSRRAGLFSLIGDVKITTETKTGKISDLEIGIPEWVYDGVVRIDNPSVLTLNPDYFLLSKGYHRFLDRLARKAAGKSDATYTLETLYKNSGSTSPYRSWKSDIKNAIASLEKNPLPDYDVKLIKRGRTEQVIFTCKQVCA